MLSRKQVTIFVIGGIVGWAGFALLIRLLPMVLDTGIWNAILFVLTIPVGWLLVSFTQRLGGLSPDQVVPGVMLFFAVALLFDGVALTWFPDLYGETAVQVRAGAGFIIWGAALTFIAALYRWHTDRL